MLRSRLWSKKLPTSNAKFALKWLKKLRKNTLLYTKNRKRQGSSKKTFKYQYHPSITNIKYIMKSENISLFSFQLVSIDKVKDIIKTLNTKKACPDGDIPVKRIKMNEYIFSGLIYHSFNQSLLNGEFPHCLKSLKKRKNLTKPNTDLWVFY